MYLITPEQHSALVYAIEHPFTSATKPAIDMLRAMEPVEPCGYAYNTDDDDAEPMPLYAVPKGDTP